MTSLKQITALTAMNIKGIPQRWSISAVTIIGIAAVVGVLISFLAIGAGARQMVTRNVRADRVVVLSQGATSAARSSLPRETAASILDAPGIKKGADGKPLAAAGLMVPLMLTHKRNQALETSQIIGVDTRISSVFPELRITEGRMFRPGVRELIAGKEAATQFAGLAPGDKIGLRGSEWTVVGRFEMRSGYWENALLADAETAMSAFDRTSFQFVTAILESPARFDVVKNAIAANPAISADVLHEAEYAVLGLGNITGLLNFVGYFVGGVMALGAICGALNTMYAAVDARRMEIATLRAIGFGASPVVVSVLMEALVLALAGVFVGSVIAWLLFNGHAANSDGINFHLAVTQRLIRLGIIWALAIGLIGALHPAIRAARLPVATALSVK